MPLPAHGVERTRLHLRRVTAEGFKRVDGLWDIELRVVDTKDQDFPLSSGLRKPGEALHDMSVRITIDRKMTILDAAIGTDAAPYMGYCDNDPSDYSRIIGLNLFQGFLKAVKEMFGSTRGCAHISELMLLLPTVALQTLSSESGGKDGSAQRPYHLDRCHALVLDSEAVQRFYPRWYHKKDAG